MHPSTNNILALDIVTIIPMYLIIKITSFKKLFYICHILGEMSKKSEVLTFPIK